jgi:RNA polymerase sigma-70 factor (ECF subfamily)
LEKLIKGCRKNEASAQAKVYQLFAGKLFALCLKYSQNYEDAEDILQDSFIRIFDKIKQFDGKGSFEGWMKRITINVALQKYRKGKKLQVVRNEVIESEETVELEEEIEANFLLELIQQLPDQYRLVFNLYVLDHFTHREIAELLNISEGTSKSNLSRARKILKEKIIAYQQTKERAFK